MNKIIITLLLATSLAGCAASILEGRRDNLLKQGYPIAYADGYYDGCSSGSATVNMDYRFRKNVNRFDADSKYRQGWTDGYNYCKAESESNRRLIGY